MNPERIAAATPAVHLCWRMGWGEKGGGNERRKWREGEEREREKGDKREILYI